MTKLNLSEQTPQPTSELDRREAELAQQHRALADDAADRRRLDAAREQATAAEQQARDLHDKMLNNIDTDIDATDDDRTGARKTHRAAREAAGRATAELTAHIQATGDLEARALELGAQARVLEQARVEAAHKAVVARKLRAALALEAVELEEHQLVRAAYTKWPDGLGLVPCTFPVGVFSAAETSIGDAKRSIFRDDVIRTVGVVYPEMLSDLLPAEEATAVLEAIEQQRARGVIYFAGRAIHWTMAGGWHTGGIAVGELKNFLRGAIRRQHQGI